MPGTSGVVSHIRSTLIHTTKLQSWQRRKLKLRKLNRLLKTHRPQGQSLKPRSGWLNSPSDTSWMFLLSGHTPFLRSSVLLLGCMEDQVQLLSPKQEGNKMDDLFIHFSLWLKDDGRGEMLRTFLQLNITHHISGGVALAGNSQERGTQGF